MLDRPAMSSRGIGLWLAFVLTACVPGELSHRSVTPDPPLTDGPGIDSGTPSGADGGDPATDGGGSPRDGGSSRVDGGSTPVDGGPLPPVGTDPRTSANVYWVGHSLISHRDVYDSSARTIFELVGDFARAQGHGYDFFRHTTPGAPLSWNWNQVPELRNELTGNGGAYDVMVLTEGISLSETIRWHFSPFYARRFQCAFQNSSPGGEAYVYESWHHLYASDPDLNYPAPHVWDWRARLDEDRPRWEQLADQAFDGSATTPDHSYYAGAGECTPANRMRLIPVGTALAALYDRMQAPRPGDDFEGFTIHHFVQNGFRNWPAEWPVPPSDAGSVDWRSRWSSLQTMRGGELDDIHPSARGAYFAALVHYATIYRRSPVGLPLANGVGAGLGRIMQETAWEVVSRDPRTGVRP